MIDLPNISPQDQARILSEALPHMQQYDEETIVIKYGGHAMGEENPPSSSPATSCCWSRPRSIPWSCMAAARRSPPCSRGSASSRSSPQACASPTPPTMEIVEMVLAGSINKSIVSHINEAGGKAVGLCGKDGNMVTATKATRTMVDPGSNIEKVVDLGFVGEPDKVDLTLLNQLIGYELIPVLAPLASSTDGKTYNVNADTFAGAVAGALKAKRLLLLTDVPGVLDKSKKLIRNCRSRTRAS
jgi:acetylglutamate kinase